ncbi:uncharacterized protein LOC111919289 [Lactuca sativa]|uniref:uncharacterized protein LOC111919289 n=1 Tax=Lactuca sativa TaxID=4236 RepID=UPI000CD8E9A9|nr:uncharacterized protein LOC111919289 [Lactuca sativa]
MRELYWEEFQKKCCWDEIIDSLVRQAWEVWNSWQLKWNTEEYKLKSKQNKKNWRNGVADGVAKPTHNAGSTNHLKIASDLKRKLGHDPPHSELFMYTHTKNHDGVTFTNEKDRQIHAAYTEKQEKLEAEGVEFEEDKLFYVVVGEEMRELVAKQKQQNEELKEMMNAQQEENIARVGHLEKQLQTTLDLINVFTKQQQ